MEKTKRSFFTAKNVSYLGVLAGLVIALQMLSGFMKIGATSFCLVLVPIVLGGIILGVGAGAFLGLLFGVVVLIDAVIGLDPLTLYLLGEQPFFTVFLCLAKGAAAGAIPALIYKLIAPKNKHVGAIVAAILAPICNTGVFAVGAFFIMQPIMDYFALNNMDISGLNPAYIVFILLIGVNFFVELAINAVLSPVIYTVNNVVEKQIANKKNSENNTKIIEDIQEDTISIEENIDKTDND
ncbi:MAG: ECF transporter S component [Candidatus Coproplasma sp.]